MPTKQVSICSAGECRGECYKCRLRSTHADLEETKMQMQRLIDLLEPIRHAHCRCENNGDYCDFCATIYDAKRAIKEAA